MVEVTILGLVRGLRNSLYYYQKRPRKILVTDIYQKASPIKFHPPRPTPWPFFTALSKSVSAWLSTTRPWLCVQITFKNGLTIDNFHNNFSSPTLLRPLVMKAKAFSHLETHSLIKTFYFVTFYFLE